MDYVIETLENLLHQTAFFNLTVGNYAMILVACVFLFLAIKKGYEPLLFVPILLSREIREGGITQIKDFFVLDSYLLNR